MVGKSPSPTKAQSGELTREPGSHFTRAGVTVGVSVLLLFSMTGVSAGADEKLGACYGMKQITKDEFRVAEGSDFLISEDTVIQATTVQVHGLLTSSPSESGDAPSICIIAEAVTVGPAGVLCTADGADGNALVVNDPSGEMAADEGLNGGDLTIILASKAGRSPSLEVQPGGILCTGDGGQGGSFLAIDEALQPETGQCDSQYPEGPTTIGGGSGGDAGALAITASHGNVLLDLAQGTVVVGSGGDGGDAFHVGNRWGFYHAVGGNGGDSTILYSGSPNLPVDLAAAVGSARGGDGGSAHAVPCNAVDVNAPLIASSAMAELILVCTEAEPRPIFCDSIDEACRDLLDFPGDDGGCSSRPLVGDPGEPASSSPGDGGNGNPGGDGSDGAVKASYNIGGSVNAGGPGINANANCIGGSDSATNGGDPAAQIGADAGDVGTIGGWGGFGWLQGGSGGEASAAGANGGKGGNGGTGGNGDVKWCGIGLPYWAEKEPAGHGEHGNMGGGSSEGGVTGGQGGNSWVDPGNGANGAATSGKGGDGGNGGNGGAGDTANAPFDCIGDCVATVGPGTVGCGGNANQGKSVTFQGGAGGQNTNPANGPISNGLSGNPINAQRTTAIPGGPGSPGATGNANDGCSNQITTLLEQVLSMLEQ